MDIWKNRPENLAVLTLLKFIERAARSDPDAQPTEGEFLSQAQIVFSIPVDQDTFRWYLNRGENIEATVRAVLMEYKERHRAS